MKKGMLFFEDSNNDILQEKSSGEVNQETKAEKEIDDESKTKEPDNIQETVSIRKEIISWIAVLVLAVFVGYAINHWMIIKAEVPTGSMETTIMPGDYILGFRLSYLFSKPERGDIVMFLYPDDESQTYVKRIIGLPGETVEIKNGYVYIDGELINEDYLKEDMLGSYGPYVVPEGCYFMMGDNRNISKDSRAWTNTYVSEDKVIGKVLFKYSPTFEWMN